MCCQDMFETKAGEEVANTQDKSAAVQGAAQMMLQKARYKDDVTLSFGSFFHNLFEIHLLRRFSLALLPINVVYDRLSLDI
jgi:hypothetical protein